MLGTPPYCSPMTRFRKSSFWVMLKACWRISTKSGLKDLQGEIENEASGDAAAMQIRLLALESLCKSYCHQVKAEETKKLSNDWICVRKS